MDQRIRSHICDIDQRIRSHISDIDQRIRSHISDIDQRIRSHICDIDQRISPHDSVTEITYFVTHSYEQDLLGHEIIERTINGDFDQAFRVLHRVQLEPLL